MPYDEHMERSEHRFVVRVWRETTAGEGQWRGVVDHVGSGRKFYFAAMSDLVDFIRLRLSETPGAPGPSAAERSKT